MINRYHLPLAFLILVALAGCSNLPYSIENGNPPGTNTAEVIAIASPTNLPGQEGTLSPTMTPEAARQTQVPGGQNLNIWVPPEFDPNSSNESNQLLNARLQAFQLENPNITLEVRVKALEGPGGMLDGLVATSAAAPSYLPDLILLPRSILESAALKGLLYPYDELTKIMEEPSWFGYALQLSQLKNSTYGLPFAANAMVVAYSTSIQSVPLTLDDLLGQAEVLLYPAADPQALFTLSMYMAEGGKIQDSQGRPELEDTPLLSILNYDMQANLAEVMPYTLTQYSEDAQVWEALLGGEFAMAVTWTNTFLKGVGVDQGDLAIAPLPTLGGTPFTLATGWSWALAGQDPAHRASAVKLAEYLVAEDFLAGWTQAAGYLPPRVDALLGWQATETRQVIEQISYSAWLVPSDDLLSTIGPALQSAVKAILEGRMDPQTAVQAAISQVNRP